MTAAVESTLNFYLDPAAGGHDSFAPGTASYYRRKFEEHEVKIENIRGKEGQFNLEKHGFQHAKHTSAEKTFDDEDRIRAVVYPECEEILKKATGATRVYTFSHVVRRSSRETVQAAVDSDPSLKDDGAAIPDVTPARYIHVDFTKNGAEQMLSDNFPVDQGNKLRRTRWSMINVWRPIKPISKDPLAMCSSLTVRDEDLMPISVTLPPKGTGPYADNISKGDGYELSYLKYNPDQQWHYVDGMQPDEVILLKCYDTIQDGKTARRVPHSAFTNPETKGDPTRESIEVRCFAFWEDQPV